jgi:dCMP deaminase
MRISFDTMYMGYAELLAQRSYDPKYKVGCIIVTEDYREVLGQGYNGNACGLPNKRDSDEQGQSGFLHAEINSCIFCRCPGNTPKLVYCTLLPCNICSKALINLGGVKKVFYKETYKNDLNSFYIFKQANIELIKL